MATIILPSYLITTAYETPKQDWGARVVSDRITEVGPNAELQAKYPDDEVIDGAGHVLAPVREALGYYLGFDVSVPQAEGGR